MADQVIHKWDPSERLVNLARRYIDKVERQSAPPAVSKWRSTSPLLNYLSDHNVSPRIYNAVGWHVSHNGAVSVDRFLRQLALPHGGYLRTWQRIGPAAIYDLRKSLGISVED